MELNTPPPGARHAKEIVPAVLRSPSVPGLRASSAPSVRTSAGDALGSMLRGSRTWDSVATPVTLSVTLLSWLLLALDIVAVFVIGVFRATANVFAQIITWDYHPTAAMVCAVIATFAMGITVAMTAGFRRANLPWLRVWIGAAIASAVAIASMLLAVALGLLFIAAGIALGLLFLFMLASAIDS